MKRRKAKRTLEDWQRAGKLVRGSEWLAQIHKQLTVRPPSPPLRNRDHVRNRQT